VRDVLNLLRASASKWVKHQAPRLGAAIAFYALLSMAPLMVLLVTIAGVVHGQSGAERKLLAQAIEFVGPQGVKAFQALIDSAPRPSHGIAADALALGISFFGASGVFLELRDALNSMWDVPADPPGVRVLIYERLVAFAMILTTGFLLLTSLVLSTALSLIEHVFAELLPMPAWVLDILNTSVSILALTAVFALVFRFVPNSRMAWRDIWVGAVATSVLFTLGKAAFALYLTTTAVGSAYGAAGSLVALIAWVYYSAQIFLFGSVLTYLYAKTFGSLQRRLG
jgi:membrane protein